jgi:magnesium chelatase family protein
MLDRIDITLETKPVDLKSLVDTSKSELSSAHYRGRVEAARDRQRFRFKDTPGVFCNAQMGPRQLRDLCRLQPGGQFALEKAVVQHGLTARAHDRILKLALTKADLEAHPVIHDDDVNFAITCRKLDRRDKSGKGVHHFGDERQKRLMDPVYVPKR